MPATQPPEKFSISGDLDQVQRWFHERGLTDGLPIIPPTEERVAAMLSGINERRDSTLGTLVPGETDATIEKLAVNAVMAGCYPEHFPVVVAAMRAMFAPVFNLLNVQTTTHPCAPLVIVSGPVARKLGVNGGAGVLGPGFVANAAIGRAVRLALMNVGCAYPGDRDRSTHGSPAKYSYCMAENIAETPWPEFHTSLGFDQGESVVTVMAAEAPHNVNDHEKQTGEEFLEIVADTMRALGHNTWYMTYEGKNDFAVVISPEHAALLENWSRRDVQQFLFEKAVRPISDLRKGGMWFMRDSPDWMTGGDDVTFSCVRDASDIIVLVAGGAGKHSCVIPGFGCSHFVTERIETRAEQ
jgi:hypothetical protein